MKFGRTYSMVVQTNDGGSIVTINYPLTLELDIQRNTLASANTGHFRIYNLREDTRRRLFKDRWQFDVYRQIVLTAGYESEPKLPIVFQGNILSCYSYRVKQDWITEIEALDGGFGRLNGQVSSTIPTGYSLRDVIVNIVRTMPKVSLGVVSDNLATDQNSRGLTVAGNSWDTINSLVPTAKAFIDNEKANVIGQNEFIGSSSQAFTINSDSGLLSTPRRFNLRLDAPIVFEPRIGVGSLVNLESLETYYNGLYCVNGVEHRGVISGAVNGECTTVLSLWKGTSLLTGVAA